jgi:hypothetical protein
VDTDDNIPKMEEQKSNMKLKSRISGADNTSTARTKRRSKSFNSSKNMAFQRATLRRRISFSEGFVCELCGKPCSETVKVMLFTQFDLHSSPINLVRTERQADAPAPREKLIKDWTHQKTYAACLHCASYSNNEYLLLMYQEVGAPEVYTLQLLEDLKKWVKTDHQCHPAPSNPPMVYMVSNEDTMKSIKTVGCR